MRAIRYRTMSAQSRNFILRNYKTMTIKEMADALKRDYHQVYWYVYKNGLLKCQKRDFNGWPYTGILTLYVNGWYIEDIMERTGQTRELCVRAIKRIFPNADIPTYEKSKVEEKDSYLVYADQEEQEV